MAKGATHEQHANPVMQIASASSNYVPRIADAELLDKLDTATAVLIEGPKACGKTSTARQIAASEVLFDTNEPARKTALTDPAMILEGDTPRLLDEWQFAPELWNHIRRSADLEPAVGRFILTGSAVPTDDHLRHTGAGRITRVKMRTLSLFEQGVASGHEFGEASLGELLAGGEVSAKDLGLEIPDLAEMICRGGWPRTMRWSFDRASRYVRDYVNEVRRADVVIATGTRRDPNKLLRLMRSLARNTATEVTLATLARDVSIESDQVKEQTLGEYLAALERLFIVENQEPFVAHLRSRSRLRKAAKRHFIDPSIATAVLQAAPESIRRDSEFLGLLFESLVVRDLRVYAAHHNAEVLHYRDNTGLEIDAIIQTLSGKWLPIEVELGGGKFIDQAAHNLLKFKQRVDVNRMGPPAKLVIVTATGYAYEREDGVSVVPIAALGP